MPVDHINHFLILFFIHQSTAVSVSVGQLSTSQLTNTATRPLPQGAKVLSVNKCLFIDE